MSVKINILLCDDHPMVLDGLKKIIEAEKDFNLLGVFASARDLQNFVQSADLITDHSIVLLLDLNLQDADGLEVCKQLSKSKPHILVIGFSSIEEPVIISTFLKNGAKSYLFKTSSSEEIINAIRAVAGGGEYFSNEVSSALLKYLQGIKTPKNYIPKLSMREKEVLTLIVQENTTGEIAEKLFISVYTLESHRNNLLQKLGVKNVAGLVRVALEKGLL